VKTSRFNPAGALIFVEGRVSAEGRILVERV